MANSTEQAGVHYCGFIAEQNKWMFRVQPVDDIGIDAHMEFVSQTGKEKQLLAVQIKTGESYFSEEKDGCIIFRKMNERQYNYWTTNSLPCILVLYNPVDNRCIWQRLAAETIERPVNGAGKGFVVKVPLSQVFLDESSNKELLSYTNLPAHIVNYNFLLSQKRFMQIIQNGGEVKLHSTEWVNKSSGRGDTEFIVDDGKNIERYPYSYWFPYTPYEKVIPKLFPWADFSADEDFFEEQDESSWHEQECAYDNEEGTWVFVGEMSFEESIVTN